jgi:hypothetical protein
MRTLVLAVLTVTALRGGARAENDSQIALLGPRAIALGEAMRGGATGSSAIGLNPAGLPLNREFVLEGGYGYRASDSASLIGLSACDSTNPMPGCFFYEYVGASPETDGVTGSRTTHVGGVALSRQLIPRILIGATAKYYHFDSDVMGDAPAKGWLFDLGATVRVTELVNLGVSAQNLMATERSPQFQRAIGAGLRAHLGQGLSIGFDSRWKLDGDDRSARFGGGAELFLRSNQDVGFPLRLGALRDNGADSTCVSAGLGVASAKWGLDVTGRREVDRGGETLVIASMRFFGPRMEAPGLGPVE